MSISRPATPYHLAPLTEGTPFSLEKLKAAWPGLVFCDKIHVLSVLLGEPGDNTDIGVLKWKRHRNFVRTIALADENEYIRYFAALSVSSDDKNEESAAVYERVVNDSSGLVVSSQDHWAFSAFMPDSDPQQGIQRFWRVAVPRRLAVAAHMLGSDIAKCLTSAVDELVPNGTLKSGELEDVVHEFLGNHSSNRKKDANELWEIVPNLPRDLSLALVLSLPPLAGDEVPQQLLDRFSEDQIRVLLGRTDIQLFDLRRKIFQSALKPNLLNAAVSSARFAILDSDISEIFADPPTTADRAVALTQSAKGATLVQKQALRWFVNLHKLSEFWVELKSEQHLKARSQDLSAKALADEILQMRLFEFAILISVEGLAVSRDRCSGDRSLQKVLGDYMRLTVAENPWETYLKLRSSVRDLARLRPVLPCADDEMHLDRKNLPPGF